MQHWLCLIVFLAVWAGLLQVLVAQVIQALDLRLRVVVEDLVVEDDEDEEEEVGSFSSR